MIAETLILLKKEFILEWRQKYALNGIVLYLTSTIFVVYLSFQVSTSALAPETWNTLFWIILLFTSINSVAKSFMQESEGRVLYAHQVASAVSIILSKQGYNTILNASLGIIGLAVFMVVFGNPVANVYLFVTNLILASMGLALTLTLLSAIASKSGQNATLMAILSFPVILPMLLVVIKISHISISGGTFATAQNELLVLLAINAIVGAVSYILFPYLWRS